MPAENVDLVVTRFLAAEVGHRLSVLGLFHQKWKISHKFSFQITQFLYKIETICHVARDRLAQKLYLGVHAES
ncbi:hypothetical protein ACOJBM_12800 [Rhizobium beringeri]